MKKTFIFSCLLLLAGVISLTTGCIEDARENYMVDDSLSLVYEEPVIEVSAYSGSATITVQKAGKGTTSAYATIGQGSDELKKWNEESDVQYQEISANLVHFSTARVSFEASDVRQSFEVNWDPAAMVGALTGDTQVIPVSLIRSDIDINPDRNLILINVVNSTASFASNGSTVTAKELATEDGELSLKLKIDHALPQDLTIRYAVDNSLVEGYNAERGADYTTAPDGYVLAGEAVIPAGKTDIFASVPLHTAVLFDGGEMMPFRTHVIPLRLMGTSLDGVIVSEKVYYLLVNSPYAGATVTRMWGRYSLENLWMTAYGLPSGADRNLALDGTWVYLPYAVGGSVAKITAISVNDPETVREVNTEGFVTATITTACVRVIDKGNGQPMLIASGAAEGNFPFYAWENGIDNPPTVYNLECTWRRGGDRFEFHGTWQDGTLYVHAYQGVFTTSYKVEGGHFVKTERTLVDVPFTGFGGFYPYPGQDQMVFSSSDGAAFVTLTGTTHKAGDGQDIWDTELEDFPGADLSWGYRVFTYRGEKYIAYTTVDHDDDLKENGTPYTTKQRARLVVVKDKGGFKASLLGDNKDIVFEAPIQGEEFTDIAIAPPFSTQGDCAVAVYSDRVIIAAGVQGIGLSVFKME